MAAVPLSFRGTLYDLLSKSQREVFLEGDAFLTGLGVGGGPMPPGPGNGGDGGKPPWEGVGKPPVIAHPIWPPTWPGQPLPPEGPGKPPEPIAPPVNWKAVWHPTEGWIVVGIISPDVQHPVPSA